MHRVLRVSIGIEPSQKIDFWAHTISKDFRFGRAGVLRVLACGDTQHGGETCMCLIGRLEQNLKWDHCIHGMFRLDQRSATAWGSSRREVAQMAWRVHGVANLVNS